MKEAPITTTAQILEQRDDHTFFAKLPNGKEIIAHIPKKLANLKSSIKANSIVSLEMTPFDFEKGRIRTVHSD